MDSHFHLDCYDDGNKDRILARAWKAGLQILVSVATSLANSAATYLQAKAWQGKIFTTVGVHPLEPSLPTNEPNKLATALETFLETAPTPPIAVGETGLDCAKISSKNLRREMEQQLVRLEPHIAVAKAAKLPLILHCRDRAGDDTAWNALTGQLVRQRFPSEKALIHCFSYDSEKLRQWQDFGGWVSFAGNLTWSSTIAASCRGSAVERTLFETDAPYLLPEPLRSKDPGQSNEPANLVHTMAKAAELLSVSQTKVWEMSLANGRRFFSLGGAGNG
ncbi:MAG: TatD family hydrolase [Puniceicoccales bacterium]|jgi:TatD DNase family protein|nr:TatD family hydrolase [Puniceicoccales bacterium]